MTVVAICPKFVVNACDSAEWTADVLYVFLQDNPFKVALDDDGLMLGMIHQLAASCDPKIQQQIHHWIRQLNRTRFRSIEKVKFNKRPKKYTTLALEIARTLRRDEGIFAIWDFREYPEKTLKSLPINTLDREATKEFLKLERKSWDPKKGAESMIDLATAATAIKTISDIVVTSEKIYGLLKKKSGHGPGANAEVIKQNETGTALIHSVSNSELKVVTREELQSLLQKSDLIYLTTLEKRMENLIRVWSSISERIDIAGIGEQARLKVELEQATKDMGDSLKATISFLEKLNFSLGDHYMAMRAITGVHE